MDKKILSSVICFALSSHAMAESYQFEVNAGYVHTKDTDSSGDKSHTAAIAGVYYFSPVKTDNHPLQEAAFLEKNGSLSLSYSSTKDSSDSYYEDSFFVVESHDNSKYSAAVLAVESYFFDDFLYVGGLISESKSEVTNNSTFVYKTNTNYNSTDKYQTDDTDNAWRVNLGIAPINNLLVWSEFQKDIDVNESWNINAKYVMEFDGSALNLQAGYGYNSFAFLSSSAIYPNNIQLNFAGVEDWKIKSGYIVGDYYFDNTLSLGLGVNHDNFIKDEIYMVRAKKFFTDSFSVQAAYIKDIYEDNYSIGVSMRF